MITLITGTPGAGKTLYAIAEVLPQYAGRTLYVDGIPDLLIDHEQPAGEIVDWHVWLPENAVLVIDEVQRVWRPRHAGSQVPPGVQAFEIHRHRGQDIVLITQHPNLLDNNIRRLVGRHLHIRRVFGWQRALVYEWDHCSDPGRISTAIKRSWGYPRKAFALYRSATAHTARHQRVAWPVWVAGAAILAIGPAIWYSVHRIKSRVETPIPVAAQGEVPTKASDQGIPDSTSAAWVPTDYQPRDPIHPESAPAYDNLRQVQAFPVVAGCVASADRCVCYTQQATRLYLPDQDCRRLSATPSFDHYRMASAGGWAAKNEQPAPGTDQAGEEIPSDNRVHRVVVNPPELDATKSISALAGLPGHPGQAGQPGGYR